LNRADTIIIGTRASPLAIAQTKLVAAELRKKNKRLKLVIKTIRTEGDAKRIRSMLRGKDLFTKNIDEALKTCKIDIAVHSLKDVPVQSAGNNDIEIAAYPEREDPLDVLVSKKGFSLENLPLNAKVGTSSIRRAIQLGAFRIDLRILELHGNVGTRLKRLKDSQMDAIVIARAGLNRLGKKSVGVSIPTRIMLPAAGQGCLAIAIRKDDMKTRKIVQCLDHQETRAAVTAERAFSESVGGGCNTPTAAYARIESGNLVLEGLVETPDAGSKVISRGKMIGSVRDPESLGQELASKLKTMPQEHNSRVREGAMLNGRTFLITRTEEGNGPLKVALERHGAKVVEFPTIRIIPSYTRRFDVIASKLEQFDWVVFTSSAGVRIFFDRLFEVFTTMVLRLRNSRKPKFACVGPATKRALEERGFRCSALPREYLTSDLGRTLAQKRISGKKVLLARAKIANRVIATMLSRSGALVTELAVYSTIPWKGRLTNFDEITDLTLTSPSTVDGLLLSITAQELNRSGVKMHCIGPVTASRAKSRGLQVETVANTHTIDGLISAILRKRSTVTVHRWVSK
jgi:hydroxymethylbilane synthase